MAGQLQLLQNMSKIKAIIFDFDGIISDSLYVKTDAFAEMYRPYGADVEQKVIQHHEAFGGVSRYEKFRIYHGEYLSEEIDDRKVLELADQFSALVLDKVVASPCIPGVHEFICKFYDKYDFFISTGTPQEEIEIVMNRKNLTPYFKEIHGSPTKKEMHVKQIMYKYGYDRSEVVFIGDATTDRDAARANQITFIGRFTTNEEIKKEKYQIKDFIGFNELLSTL